MRTKLISLLHNYIKLNYIDVKLLKWKFKEVEKLL